MKNSRNDFCGLCPRNCGVNRTAGERGFCGETNSVRIARASVHMWEEPCISGNSGSGTVFFTGCPLGCVYCQNRNISNGKNGIEVTPYMLEEIFFKLCEMGVNNINLVTPTHFVPVIADVLKRAKSNGLRIPIVYNTGSYENVATLKMLDGLIDIYLPDLKYYSSDTALRYSKAPDYFDVSSGAIAEMYRQVGPPVFDENGIMKRGVLVRHLVLPGHTDESKDILRYLYSEYGDNIYISIMNQFTPLDGLEGYPEINRKLTDNEYDEVVDFAVDLGIENAFIQDGETASESFIPDFENFDINDFLG